MRKKDKVVVVGLGEVGKPLLELVSRHHDAIGVDISPVERIEQVDILHVCYPFQIRDFVGETVRYIEHFRPTLTIVNSTVAIGTTRAIAERTGACGGEQPRPWQARSHARRVSNLHQIRGRDQCRGGEQAATHFESLGLKAKVLSSPEATELAKLTETTYFGLMIAWAQEVERYCDQSGEDYNEVVSFYEEIKFFPPVKYVPGVIGGHCVMQNIEILQKHDHSVILSAIQASNKMKIEREAQTGEEAVAVGDSRLRELPLVARRIS